jgi:hypothetical protein
MHKDKYEWFMSLAEAVKRDDILIPESAMAKMLELGILQDRHSLRNMPPAEDDAG